MESFTNEQQAILEKAIWKFLEENRKLVLRRLIGIDKLELSAPNEITIVVNATGKVVVKRQ
jgi:hypothetical protein